ncbi:hypothetical protein ACFL5A_01590 [Gemmatimonadota bacterium]
MSDARHLLSLWNPTYSDVAMDVHLRVLLRWAELSDQEDASPADIYVWWARLKSPDRKGPHPFREEILTLDQQIRDGVETHLYLTDYRSLYVGHLAEITADDVPTERPREKSHIPDYVLEHEAIFWFRLRDLRQVVSGDLAGTELEIQKLRSLKHGDRPVSIYGGISDAPCMVRRDPPVAWFEKKEELTGGQLWAQLEAQLRGESKRVARQLRDNLFGSRLWRAMEPASRTFLTSAEAVFRSRMDDPGFDFSGVAIEYAKAVEIELNALLFPALRTALGGKAPKQREIHGLHSRLDLGKPVPHQTLGAMGHILEHEPLVQKGIKTVLHKDASWILSDSFQRDLGALLKLRNPAAHWEITMGEMVGERRAELLGIGCEGFLVRLIRAKVRSGR